MSKAAVSMFVFALYLYVLGLVLVVVPNLLLSVFGMAQTDEVWIRVAGMLVLILGFYYQTAARGELTAMMRASVIGRSAVILFFVGFVISGLAPPVLIVFGVVDAAAALWTGAALRTNASS
jgi:hypothetical protein